MGNPSNAGQIVRPIMILTINLTYVRKYIFLLLLLPVEYGNRASISHLSIARKVGTNPYMAKGRVPKKTRQIIHFWWIRGGGVLEGG